MTKKKVTENVVPEKEPLPTSSSVERRLTPLERAVRGRERLKQKASLESPDEKLKA